MTFTKLYLTNQAAPYTPATVRGAWDQTASAVTKRLTAQKTFTTDNTTSTAIAETDAAANWDVLIYRGVSEPIAAQTFGGTVDVCLGVDTSSTSADFAYHVHIYVTQGDSDTVRGTLLTDYVETTANEWPATDTALRFASAQSLAAVAASDGDRIVVEIGYVALNASASSFTGRVYYGTTNGPNVYLSDLTAGDNPSTTPGAGFIEFSAAVTEYLNNAARISRTDLESAILITSANTVRVSRTDIEVPILITSANSVRVSRVDFEVIYVGVRPSGATILIM